MKESLRLVKDISREHVISYSTYYDWKAKCGVIQVSEVQRTKELQDENVHLKRIMANLILEIDAVKNVLEKKDGSLTLNGRQ